MSSTLSEKRQPQPSAARTSTGEFRTPGVARGEGRPKEKRRWRSGWVILLIVALVALLLTVAFGYHVLGSGDTLGR